MLKLNNIIKLLMVLVVIVKDYLIILPVFALMRTSTSAAKGSDCRDKCHCEEYCRRGNQ